MFLLLIWRMMLYSKDPTVSAPVASISSINKKRVALHWIVKEGISSESPCWVLMITPRRSLKDILPQLWTVLPWMLLAMEFKGAKNANSLPSVQSQTCSKYDWIHRNTSVFPDPGKPWIKRSNGCLHFKLSEQSSPFSSAYSTKRRWWISFKISACCALGVRLSLFWYTSACQRT